MRTSNALKVVPSLQEQADLAREEIAGDAEALRLAEATLEALSAALGANPDATVDELNEKARWEHKASVLRATHARTVDGHAGLLRDAEREKQEAELAEIESKIGAKFHAAGAARVRDLVTDFRMRFRGEVAALKESVTAENILRRRAQSLSDALGRQARVGFVNIDEVIRGIVDAIHPNNPHVDSHVALNLSNVSGDPARGEVYRLEIVDLVRGGK